jgi:fluoride exporter
MRKALIVFAGGFCGTLARYLLAAPLLSLARLGLPGARALPYDILFINLAGALAIGLLYGLFDRAVLASPAIRLALGTGFLGGFTTFSTFAYGGERLLNSGAWATGLLYLCGTLLVGVALAWLGYSAAGLLAGSAAPSGWHGTQARHARRSAGLAAEMLRRESEASDEDVSRWLGGRDHDRGEVGRRIPGEVR